MTTIEEITKLLKSYECHCFELDEKNSVIYYLGGDYSCCSLNQAVANLTGYLLLNDIDYFMNEEKDIVLKNLS